jgi:sortase A
VKPITKGRMFRPAPTRSLVRRSPHFFFIVGILALGYVAVTLLEARLYQVHEARRFEQARQERQMRKSASPSGSSQSPEPPPLPARPGQRDHAATEDSETAGRSRAWGRIEISSIGLSAMILEGVDQGTLRRAVGHIPGTALPGHPGNAALAGHRDTFFRALRNIRKDDEITLETLDGSYRYRVDFTRVVAPGYIEVLDGSDDAILTLVTCYPFSFVGPAPQRYIVRAHKIPE